MTNSRSSRITILLSLYNHEHFIEDCIQSILDQSFACFDLWVLDDCSTDNSLKVVEKFANRDSRISIKKSETNLGKAAQLNSVLPLVKTEYLAFIDSDDLWVKENLRKKIEILDNSRCDLVFSDGLLLDSRSDDELSSAWPKSIESSTFWDIHKNPRSNSGNMWMDIIEGNFIFYSSVVMRNERLKSGTRFSEHINRSMDWLFFCSVLKNSACIAVKEPLAVYRIHGNNLQVAAHRSPFKNDARLHVIREYGMFLSKKAKSNSYYVISRDLLRLKRKSEALGYAIRALKLKKSIKNILNVFDCAR